MGRPFQKELDRMDEIIRYTCTLDVTEMTGYMQRTKGLPKYIIGSGGSFSACVFAELLHLNTGRMAKAITPIDTIYFPAPIRHSSVLIISASGKNKDILLAFSRSVEQEPQEIAGLCAVKNSPLAKEATKFSDSNIFEYPLPTGKDGFLASNSLLAFFIILARSYHFPVNEEIVFNLDKKRFVQGVGKFLEKMNSKRTVFTVLYAGWGKPAAVDIESKLTEAALAPSLLADYRNFGHGRHHWFDKKGEHSAVIALVTSEEKELAEKTLSVLPSWLPVLLISSQSKGPEASIDLLIKSFYVVGEIGALQKIDPGKPGVPGYGSKLYRLSYSSIYKQDNKRKNFLRALKRKITPLQLTDLTAEELIRWENAYSWFYKKLLTTKFAALILDYDRTICSDCNRFNGVDIPVIAELTKLIEAGILIGIVTGRGQSVKDKMREAFPEKYRANIFIGYYNGGQIANLTDNSAPDSAEGEVAELISVEQLLSNIKDIKLTRRKQQLTVESQTGVGWDEMRQIIYQRVMAIREGKTLITESSRSVDIIRRPEVSKLNMESFIKNELNLRLIKGDCLCIGDKGRYPGNDFEILNTEFSLSVNEASMELNSCWNLAPPGIRNVDACLHYLKRIKIKRGHFNILIDE